MFSAAGGAWWGELIIIFYYMFLQSLISTGYLNTLRGATSRMDESTSFERIDRSIRESIRPVLKADGGDITLIDFSDGVVKIALEKTRVPVAFSNFPVTFKVGTGCSCGRCPIPSVIIRGVF